MVMKLPKMPGEEKKINIASDIKIKIKCFKKK